MPVETTSVTRISCDNPACPGNDLDPAERLGWLFISSEVYGESTVQTVFCSYGCLGAAGTAREAGPKVSPFAPETVA
jgi:hypothetical protein